MATSLADAAAGEVVTLPSGKVVVSDGQGGGRVQRKKKKKQVVSNTAAQGEAPEAPEAPEANEDTVARGIRAAAEQGSKVTELIRLGRGRPR